MRFQRLLNIFWANGDESRALTWQTKLVPLWRWNLITSHTLIPHRSRHRRRAAVIIACANKAIYLYHFVARKKKTFFISYNSPSCHIYLFLVTSRLTFHHARNWKSWTTWIINRKSNSRYQKRYEFCAKFPQHRSPSHSKSYAKLAAIALSTLKKSHALILFICNFVCCFKWHEA